MRSMLGPGRLGRREPHVAPRHRETARGGGRWAAAGARARWENSGRWLATVALLLAPAAGNAATEAYSPRNHPGAIEVGVAGTLTSVEGATRVDVTLRGGTFRRAGSGLTGVETEVSYGHVGSLDLIDLEGALSWLKPLGDTALYPFLAAAGGVRQERLGSFRQVRYPVGFDAGLRVLASPRAGVRLEYHYRRILGDPVAEYSEHQVIAGLSLFFRNPQEAPRRGMRMPRFPRNR